MKQIDTKATKFRLLGTVFLVGETTMLLFGAAVMLISLVGWHTLVFSQYIPNLYVFMVMLAGLWILLAMFVYKVLLPVAFRFRNEQQWSHSSPVRQELKKIREDIQQIRAGPDLAWLACAIDGEGWIGLYARGRSGRQLAIGVGNTNRAFLEKVKEVIGFGNISREKSAREAGKDHFGTKPFFRFYLSGRRCIPLLEALLPYFIVKKDKAEKILEELQNNPFKGWRDGEDLGYGVKRKDYHSWTLQEHRRSKENG